VYKKVNVIILSNYVRNSKTNVYMI